MIRWDGATALDRRPAAGGRPPRGRLARARELAEIGLRALEMAERLEANGKDSGLRERQARECFDAAADLLRLPS